MHNRLSQEELEQGYKLLFDGQSLEGWGTTNGSDGWGVEDDCIVCLVKGDGYVYTREKYENFVLKTDYRIDPGVNSGIFFRWSDLTDPVNTGLEMQVLDTAHKEEAGIHDCGALYDLAVPSANAALPAGEWNHVEIVCEGSRIRLHLNGTCTVDVDIDRWAEVGKNPDGTPNKFAYAWSGMPRLGHIGFQDHGGKVWYRNIKLLPL
ncbi:3-keto-disaccharide hydrolase [Paenibacillus thermotolerans]|uniref:3-keto-disaccharide hydrolase n=1 Tax=Paenibacillus thermotolerans TaxID=3027807 RepID=UPI0023675A09|nr:MULTISPECIES: DUF1080 domain-containing protein [unclassified Paenibacillus]